ncbi:Hint domain-containing protein [Ancylobacter sp. Lp-2]|uniref:Hint domain-containing protein n=1 Tax=Ancylobacter sp. Lp-2 TaxID=2881339 RepID=UPI001E567FF2|nr:Hint domain-containing protein [Ancylobacter sp. Lp-2]MCB4771919.1 Hint domain-containing protein [Ancylobacter sp. Lp-2]
MAGFESRLFSGSYSDGVFTPNGGSSPAGATYVVAEGTYAIGSTIPVDRYDNGGYNYTDTYYKLVGTAANGWIAERFGAYYYFAVGSNPTSAVAVDTVSAFVACFLAGTLIATPSGAVPIETLAAGDLVLTDTGEARPVRWLARRTVSRLFADPAQVLPVRILAGALDEGLPARDLFLSPDHALLVDGLLVQAGALVNGTSVVRHADMPLSFVYYHVELDGHALVLAEGVPAETFVDNVSRRRFDNHADYAALYGEEPAPLVEIDRPRVKSVRQLPPAIRARLATRAAAMGGGGQEAADVRAA